MFFHYSVLYSRKFKVTILFESKVKSFRRSGGACLKDFLLAADVCLCLSMCLLLLLHSAVHVTVYRENSQVY